MASSLLLDMGKRGIPKGIGWNGKLRQAMLELPNLTPAEIKEDLEARRTPAGERIWPVRTRAHYSKVRQDLVVGGELSSLSEVRDWRKRFLDSYLGRSLPEAYVPLESGEAKILRAVFGHQNLSNLELGNELAKNGLNVRHGWLSKLRMNLAKSKAILRPQQIKPKKLVVLSPEQLKLKERMRPYATRYLARLADKHDASPSFRKELHEGLERPLDLAARRFSPNRQKGGASDAAIARFMRLTSNSLAQRKMASELAKRLNTPLNDAVRIIAVSNTHLRGFEIAEKDKPLLEMFLSVRDKLPFKLAPSPKYTKRY